jgi:dTDP-L-rhamnose 4-epimerase
MKVLVTGGAGFIGSHTTDLLLARGHRVKILDSLAAPTHKGLPHYLSAHTAGPYGPHDAEFIQGDVRREEDVRRALRDVEVVFHLAAAGGYGLEPQEYMEVNTLATARILQMIAEEFRGVEKIIVASSVAVYGEGKYRCRKDGEFHPEPRSPGELARGEWEMKCPCCGAEVEPLPVSEEDRVAPASPYALSKYDQERLVLNFGREHRMPTVALRYFLTYGPRQSLLNPYTGVTSIFATRIINDLPPVVYEDGRQKRDFIFVEDVAEANLLAMESDALDGEAVNVGSGRATSILDLARALAQALGKKISPELRGEYRPYDVRHIFADIAKLKRLGFQPETNLEQGLGKFLNWLARQRDIKEYFTEAEKQMKAKGIIQKKK